MSDYLKPNRRYKFSGEGVTDEDGDIWVGEEYINPVRSPDIKFELISEPLPTEPGSVATFTCTGSFGEVEEFQGVLFGKKWHRLDNANLESYIRIDDYRIKLVSVDRIGV